MAKGSKNFRLSNFEQAQCLTGPDFWSSSLTWFCEQKWFNSFEKCRAKKCI